MAGGYYYTTKQGDMWDYIAYLVYGDEYQMPVLLRANPELNDIHIFEAGAEIWCPELTISEESENESAPDWRDMEDIEDEPETDAADEEEIDEEE